MGNSWGILKSMIEIILEKLKRNWIVDDYNY